MTFPVFNLPGDLAVSRLTIPRHTAAAFSGEEAKLHGGRWNAKGHAMVYTASSLSLALLEMLVQADPLPGYVAIYATLPAGLPVAFADHTALPANWREPVAPVGLREMGTEWLLQGKTCALSVPSAVVPSEKNYLLNPSHPDFSRIRIVDAEIFTMDERILESFRS